MSAMEYISIGFCIGFIANPVVTILCKIVDNALRAKYGKSE